MKRDVKQKNESKKRQNQKKDYKDVKEMESTKGPKLRKRKHPV